MVSNLSIISMFVSLFIGVILPLCFSIFLIVKNKFSIKCFLIGMSCFLLCAYIIEGFFHNYFLSINKTTSDVLLNNTLYYCIYGCLMAGIFEEVGRFIFMNLFMKKEHRYKDGIIFGLGHGIMEAILLLGLACINNIVYSIMINRGNFDSIINSLPEESKGAVAALKNALTTTSPWMFLLGGFERICAIIIHVAFSLVVLYGIKIKKIKYLFIAILGHALVDVPSALYQRKAIPLNLVYILLISSVIILLFVIMRLRTSYKKYYK